MPGNSSGCSFWIDQFPFQLHSKILDATSGSNALNYPKSPLFDFVCFHSQSQILVYQFDTRSGYRASILGPERFCGLTFVRDPGLARFSSSQIAEVMNPTMNRGAYVHVTH